jgi:uncharacterized damage-inducible protein DinB
VKTTELVRIWEERRANLRKLAEGIPEGREGYAIAPGLMSLGGHVLHILSAEKTAVDALTVTPGKWVWETGIDPVHYPSRQDIFAALERQSAETRKYLQSLSDARLAEQIKLPWGGEMTVEVFWVHWMTHDAHHCGSLVATMRAGGIEPPNIWG